MSSFDGAIALVTGAASGIGAAIAAAYATKGARVAVVDLNLDAAQAQASNLEGAQAFACDVSDSASVEAAVREVLGSFGRIDILVNSAGIVDLAPAEDISLHAWQRTLDVNLTGSFLMAQAVGRAMIAQGGGKIVNLASQAGSVTSQAKACASGRSAARACAASAFMSTTATRAPFCA